MLVNVERKTRYLMATKIESPGSAAITRTMIEFFRGLSRGKLTSITLDNGSEFAGYREMERELKIPLYFCNPHSPWEKPTVENTNGLIRQMTRKIDLQKLSSQELDKLVRLINDRPRKCLNWRTPAEVFRSI